MDLCIKLLNNLYILSRFSFVWLCASLWTVACQASLSMEFSRQEYWNTGCHALPPPGDFPNPGGQIWAVSLKSPTLAGVGSCQDAPRPWQGHKIREETARQLFSPESPRGPSLSPFSFCLTVIVLSTKSWKCNMEYSGLPGIAQAY